jgi:hypothetical protein
MKNIKVMFLTEKGFIAYRKIEAEKTPWKFRQIMKFIYKEKLMMGKNPYILIEFKRGIIQQKMAADMNLFENIPEGLSKYGAEKDTDYTIEVEE